MKNQPSLDAQEIKRIIGSFEKDLLVHGARPGGELSDAGLDLYGVSQESWPSVTDIDVDNEEGGTVSFPLLEIDVLLKESPAGFFQKLQVAGVVYVSIEVNMIASDLYLRISFHGLEDSFAELNSVPRAKTRAGDYYRSMMRIFPVSVELAVRTMNRG